MVNMSPFFPEQEKKAKKSRKAAINWPFKKSLHKTDSTDGGHILANNNNLPTSNGCNGCKLFGQSLHKYFNGDSLIPPIMNMLKELYMKGPDTVGIFRKSANARVCRELKTRLEEKPDADLEEFPVIVIGSVFKEFLRTLPDSILQSKNYYKWVDAVNQDNNLDCREKVMKLLSNLPSINLILLRHFLCVLWHISKRSSENKMCSINLGVCVGPSLLSVKEASIHRCEEISKQVPKLVAYLIDHCPEILGEGSLTLFGQQMLKDKQDSGAEESDSLKSLQENSGYYELSGHQRRDDSSLDSIERVLIDSDNRNSNDDSDLKNSSSEFENKMSLSNLSRDSGLTLSDTQLYSLEDDDDEEDEENQLSNSPRIVTNNRLLPHLTKSVPHLDSAGLDNYLNVTFSYGRSVGVSIDGSCHDVVRKRRHQDVNGRNRSNTSHNNSNSIINGHARSSCPNGIQHLQKINEAPKSHIQVHCSKSYSYGIDSDEIDGKMDKIKLENEHTPRNGQRYRHRRPPLAAILSHANQNNHETIFKAHCLRRSSSEESIRINFENNNNNNSNNGNNNSKNANNSNNHNHEPISLPYGVNKRDQNTYIDANKNSNYSSNNEINNKNNSLISRNLIANNIDYNMKRITLQHQLQQQQKQHPQPQQTPVTRKASINISTMENKLKISSIPSNCSLSSLSPSSSEITTSHRSTSSSTSKKSSLSPLCTSPPSYQETMNRKELFARIQNNAYASRQISSSAPYNSSSKQIFEESVRVYNADIQKGSNIFLRAIPVRIKDTQENASSIYYNQSIVPSNDFPCKQSLCRLSSEQQLPTTDLLSKRPLRFTNSVKIRNTYQQQPNHLQSQHQQQQQPLTPISIEERCAKDFTDDWRKEINLSVAQLRSLFNDKITDSNKNYLANVDVKASATSVTPKAFNKHENLNEKDNHHLKDSCVTVIHVTQNEISCSPSESHLHKRCDSLASSEEESYV